MSLAFFSMSVVSALKLQLINKRMHGYKPRNGKVSLILPLISLIHGSRALETCLESSAAPQLLKRVLEAYTNLRIEHDEDFLTHGLWSKSRHPNYFGESTLWTGIAVTSAGVLASKIGQMGMGLAGTSYGRFLGLGMCFVSPAFVTFLLLKVSGVPMSENKYDKKYGDRKDYKAWKENTPMFFPKF
jgi:protein-S-isoprenylcysteine O-methyltransferase Ste14